VKQIGVGYESKDLIPQQRSPWNRLTCTTKLTLQIAEGEALIVNRSTPSILRTATLIVECLLQQIEQDVGELRRQKPLPREFLGFFSAITPSTQLGLVAFYRFFLCRMSSRQLQEAQ
jgi:hypothetical protein